MRQELNLFFKKFYKKLLPVLEYLAFVMRSINYPPLDEPDGSKPRPLPVEIKPKNLEIKAKAMAARK